LNSTNRTDKRLSKQFIIVTLEYITFTIQAFGHTEQLCVVMEM